MKRLTMLTLLIGLWLVSSAQSIPEPLEYTEIYDFINELSAQGVIQVNTAVRPYSRRQIAHWLQQAAESDGLSRRQQQEVDFYLQDYALELDTIPNYRLYGHDNVCQWTKLKNKEAKCDFNLALVDPSLHILTKDKMFKFRLRPILGMDIYYSRKGMITKRWYGADIQMDIAHHLSIWGSIRDNSWKGTGKGFLKDEFFPSEGAKRDGARLTKPGYLNMLSGVQYKESNYGGDFSDSRGGISLYAWWGSIGLQRERIQWGDAQYCSNILSGHSPAVPMLTMQLTPCSWFQFDYFHAWLVSNVLDPNYYYQEQNSQGETEKELRPYNKFMAANLFTFMPCKYIHFSFGNSIVYAERNVQAAYFIPVAFYKSLDHLLTKGVNSENQNSQLFGTLTVRPVDQLRLYGTFYLDEFKLDRLKPSNPANNPISYQVGFDWSGWPVKGLSLRGEFTRSYIATYTHSINVLTYATNDYNMGHFMGDNAQSIFVQLAYRPVRGLRLSLDYACNTKYNAYKYLRESYDEQHHRVYEGGIGEVIAQKPFRDRIWQNDEIGFHAVYEIFNNCYAHIDVNYNHARAFTPADSHYCLQEGSKEVAKPSMAEDRGQKNYGDPMLEGEALQNYYLNKYSPVYFQGKNLTFTCGMSFGF